MDVVPQKPQKSTRIRRSQRLLLVIRVSVSGKNPTGANFTEDAFTQVVNAHGALVVMKHLVSLGDQLLLRNIKTGEEIGCKVVDVGDRIDHKTAVGVEFNQPSPRFWRVTFPPDDWSSKDPEAKRFSGSIRPVRK